MLFVPDMRTARALGYPMEGVQVSRGQALLAQHGHQGDNLESACYCPAKSGWYTADSTAAPETRCSSVSSSSSLAKKIVC
jgi:hypothetical protein